MYPFMNPKTFAKNILPRWDLCLKLFRLQAGKKRLGITQIDEKRKLKYVINDLYTDLYKMF